MPVTEPDLPRSKRLRVRLAIVAMIVAMLFGIWAWRSRSPELDKLAKDVAITWTDSRITLLKETRKKQYSSWMFDKPRGAEILQQFAVDKAADPLDVLRDYQKFLTKNTYEPMEEISRTQPNRAYLSISSDAHPYLEAGSDSLDHTFYIRITAKVSR